MAAIPSDRVVSVESLVLGGIRSLPRRSADRIVRDHGEGKSVQLTSTQAAFVCASINRAASAADLFRPGGTPLLDYKDLAPPHDGNVAKPTWRGCLDPCEGVSVSALMTLIRQRLGGG